MKRKPRRLSSFAIAVDSGVIAGTSPSERGAGRVAGSGANDQSSAGSPAGSSRVARALAIAAVARFGPADVERLLGDAGIVRNRAKIEATIHNAARVLELERPLDDLLWSFAPATHPRPATLADVPATSPESTAMATELKRRGLRFVGPTTCYALMQAAGLVDDHVADCWRAAAA